jgi:hypothetical protein
MEESSMGSITLFKILVKKEKKSKELELVS